MISDNDNHHGGDDSKDHDGEDDDDEDDIWQDYLDDVGENAFEWHFYRKVWHSWYDINADYGDNDDDDDGDDDDDDADQKITWKAFVDTTIAIAHAGDTLEVAVT